MSKGCPEPGGLLGSQFKATLSEASLPGWVQGGRTGRWGEAVCWGAGGRAELGAGWAPPSRPAAFPSGSLSFLMGTIPSECGFDAAPDAGVSLCVYSQGGDGVGWGRTGWSMPEGLSGTPGWDSVSTMGCSQLGSSLEDGAHGLPPPPPLGWTSPARVVVRGRSTPLPPAGSVRCHWGLRGPQNQSEPPLQPSGRPATMREPMAGGSSLSRGVPVVPPRATPGCGTSHGAGDTEQAAWRELFPQGPTPGHLLGLSPLPCLGGWSWRDPDGVRARRLLLGGHSAVVLSRWVEQRCQARAFAEGNCGPVAVGWPLAPRVGSCPERGGLGTAGR